MSRFNFTDAAVARLSAPLAGRAYHYDHGGRDSQRGLGCAVTPAGTVTYFWQGRVSGLPMRVTLGRHPDMSVADARRRAGDARAAAIEGLDPRIDVSPRGLVAVGAPTVGDIWRLYVSRHLAAKGKNWRFEQGWVLDALGPLAAVDADRLTPEALAAWHARLGIDRGQPAANKLLAAVHRAYRRAATWRRPDGRPWVQTDPASATAVPRFREFSRDRFLRSSELRPFLMAVADHELATARHALQMLLWTAARKSAVLSMRWEDIDMSAWIWTIPRESMKGSRASHPVPLVRQARYIIEARVATRSGDYVFPGRRRGAHITTVEGWWREIRTASGIEDIVPHDLRRTMASWMAMTGASLPIIAQMLGHALPGVTSIYARLAVEPVREAAQVAADKIMEVAELET